MTLSWKGFQSVSNTAAVCPRNSGRVSGRRPFSSMGMTANAPPPLASQLTEMYSGFACSSLQQAMSAAPSPYAERALPSPGSCPKHSSRCASYRSIAPVGRFSAGHRNPRHRPNRKRAPFCFPFQRRVLQIPVSAGPAKPPILPTPGLDAAYGTSTRAQSVLPSVLIQLQATAASSYGVFLCLEERSRGRGASDEWVLLEVWNARATLPLERHETPSTPPSRPWKAQLAYDDPKVRWKGAGRRRSYRQRPLLLCFVGSALLKYTNDYSTLSIMTLPISLSKSHGLTLWPKDPHFPDVKTPGSHAADSQR